MNTIHPLRLATGSHKAGSGKGCAMNVISWESGDTTITDMPACADRMLALVVQRVNDSVCTHRDGDLLCPTCSVAVLDLAHRIVGTGTHPLTVLERRQVWVRVAATEARSVLHLTGEHRDVALAAILAAEQWAAEPSFVDYAAAAAVAAARADAYAAYAARAAAAAARAARDADAAAADAYAAAPSTEGQLERAHRTIDLWYEYAGFTPDTIPAEVTEQAVARMLAVAP
jgi:hypothetical protein